MDTTGGVNSVLEKHVSREYFTKKLALEVGLPFPCNFRSNMFMWNAFQDPYSGMLPNPKLWQREKENKKMDQK